MLLVACGRIDFAAKPIVASFEAESGVLVAPFAIGADPAASGGAFVVDGNPQGVSGPGSAHYDFAVARSATYYAWARTRAVDTATDSFFIAFDAGVALNFDTSSCVHSPAWLWHRLHEAISNCPIIDPPLELALVAGPHVILLTSREGQSAIDQVLITDDVTLVPAD